MKKRQMKKNFKKDNAKRLLKLEIDFFKLLWKDPNNK